MPVKTTMTPKERVECSLQWCDPDRVPIQIYLTPEIEASLREYFNGDDPLEYLEVDFRLVDPESAYRGKLKSPEGKITFDMWGTGYQVQEHGAGGAYEESVITPLGDLHTMDEVEAYPWPNPDDFDYSALVDLCKAKGDYVIYFGSAGYPDILNGVSRGRGMEQVMMDIALRDEVGMEIIQRRCDISYQIMRRGLESASRHIDILCIGEDCGNQLGRMFSPKDFDEVFRPQLQRFIDLAHEFGIRAMMHSCGDTHDLQSTFIEMGLDILDAMQPEPAGMQPIEKIRENCRNKMAFCGLISTQSTLPFGSEEQCRAEARHRIDVIAPGGGYFFSPAHCIQAGTPLNNILAVYGEVLGKTLIS